MAGGYRDLFIVLGFRLVITSPLFILATALLLLSGANIVGLLAGCLFMLMGFVAIARPIAWILAEPFGNILYSVEHFDKPPPVYSIPQARVQEHKFEEAITLYEEIAEKYPEETRPYMEMMRVAAVYLKDERRTQKIFYEGLLKFKRKKDKDNLAIAYKSMRSRLEDIPEWNQKRVISRRQDSEPED